MFIFSHQTNCYLTSQEATNPLFSVYVLIGQLSSRWPCSVRERPAEMNHDKRGKYKHLCINAVLKRMVTANKISQFYIIKCIYVILI